jgi:digeranylgeranylglycerophospholipid reductase
LAQEAESRGAKFVFNAKLKTPPKADYIVGADGIMGITRTWCSLPLPAKHDLHLGVQVLAKPLEEPELVQLFFGRCAPGGYAWVFPDPREDLAKVGLGVPLSCPENAGALLKLFIRRHKFKPKTKMSCKLIPTAPPLNRYVFSNILLTGDAAQATDPSTGGGIPAALLSGQLAASCIAQRRPDLYQKLMVKKVNTRNRIRYAIKEALFALTDREYELLVDGIKSVTPSDNFSFSVVEAIGRILMSHPRLITKTKLLRRIAKAYFAGG